MRREVKARSTKDRRRVWRGGEDGVAGGGVGGADQPVIGPVKERTRGAGGFVERVGVLHEGRIGGGLVQGFHAIARLRDSGMMPWATSTPIATKAAAAA